VVDLTNTPLVSQCDICTTVRFPKTIDHKVSCWLAFLREQILDGPKAYFRPSGRKLLSLKKHFSIPSRVIKRLVGSVCTSPARVVFSMRFPVLSDDGSFAVSEVVSVVRYSSDKQVSSVVAAYDLFEAMTLDGYLVSCHRNESGFLTLWCRKLTDNYLPAPNDHKGTWFSNLSFNRGSGLPEGHDYLTNQLERGRTYGEIVNLDKKRADINRAVHMRCKSLVTISPSYKCCLFILQARRAYGASMFAERPRIGIYSCFSSSGHYVDTIPKCPCSVCAVFVLRALNPSIPLPSLPLYIDMRKKLKVYAELFNLIHKSEIKAPSFSRVK